MKTKVKDKIKKVGIIILIISALIYARYLFRCNILDGCPDLINTAKYTYIVASFWISFVVGALLLIFSTEDERKDASISVKKMFKIALIVISIIALIIFLLIFFG